MIKVHTPKYQPPSSGTALSSIIPIAVSHFGHAPQTDASALRNEPTKHLGTFPNPHHPRPSTRPGACACCLTTPPDHFSGFWICCQIPRAIADRFWAARVTAVAYRDQDLCRLVLI